MDHSPETNPRGAHGHSAKISVLFVDDEKDYVELAVRFLRNGCVDSVDGLTSARAALERLEDTEYDVIICDYLMPEMDGPQLLKEIRSRGIDTPFVLMTGKDMDDGDPIALGADLHVQKTGDMRQRFSELSDTIRNLACWKRAERKLTGERDLFRNIVDSNMIGLLALDGRRNVAIWNKGIASITGIDKASVIGRPFSIQSSPILSSIVSEEEVDGLLRGRMRPSSRRTWVDPGTGGVRHFEVGMFPMLSRDGEFTAGLIHVLDSTQRVQLTEALERSEKKYRQLVEMADEGIWSVDRDNRITFANPQMASIMASKPEEMIGRRLSDLVSERDREFADEALRLLTEGTSVELDFDFVNLAGKRQVVSFKASPMLDRDGVYSGAVAVFIDLAARRLVEGALTESLKSQEEFGRIVNASPIVVFKLDPIPPWRVEFVSDNVTQFGFIPDDFAGGRTNFADVVHPDDLERVESEVLDHVTAGEDVFGIEYRGFTKSGETRNISAQVLARRNTEGNVVGFQGVIIDDTERKRGMDEVQRLASVVENSMDAIVSKSTDGTIQTWNPAAEALYGYSATEAIGKSITMLVPPDRLDEFYKRFRQVKRGIRVPPFETVRLRKDGSRVDVSLTISPVLNDMGRIIGASAIARDITLRKRASEALKRSEDKFSKAFNSSPDIIAIISLSDARIVDVNDTCAKLVGISKDELMGKSALELPFVDPDTVDRYLEEVTSSGSLRGVEIDFMDMSGEKHSALVSAEAIDVEGEPCLLVVAADITKQRAAEARLRLALENLRQLETIITTSPAVALLWRAEPGWPIEYASENISQFGYSAQEVVSRHMPMLDIVHPGDREMLEESSMEHKQGETRSYQVEYRVLTASGQTRWVEERSYTFMDDDGNETFGCGVLLDVTSRKNAEEALRTSEEKFRTIVELSNEWIWIMAPEGTMTYNNPTVERILGYSSEALQEEDTLKYMVEEDRRQIEEMLPGFIERREGWSNLVVRWKRADGSIVYLESSSRPLFDADGRFEGFLGSDRDITERMKAEEALKAANDKLALMGSITRHDVINQIGILSGYLSLIEEETGDAKTRSQYLSAARKACSTITEQLQFAGSYQKAGTKDPEWTRVRLELAGAVSTIDMGEISVTESLGDLEILADPMFEKVFVNLLVNTRRHSEKATRVDVTLDRRGEDVFIVYSDDGIGIAEDEKEKVFNRGYGKDSGLGLFLIREVLTMTGIAIHECGRPGEGARFEIAVPAGKFRFGSEDKDGQ